MTRLRLALAAALLFPMLLGACAGSAGTPVAAAHAVEPTRRSMPEDATARPVRSLEFEWYDAARERTVPVRLYLPIRDANSTTDALDTLPLVVFSHGLGGSRAGYSHLGRHWAGEGFASLHLQHAGSDRAVWRTGGTLERLRALQAAASPENAIARAQDVSFALDRLLADPTLAAAVDPTRIAVAGHSYGANTAMLVAGARFEQGGLPMTLRDPRVRAAVLMSAPPFPAGFDTGRVLAGIEIPTLHLTTVDDVIRIPGHWSEARDRVALYEALPAAPKWLAVFDFGEHNVFTDRGVDPRAQAVKKASRDLSTAFMRTVLDGRTQSLDIAFAAHAGMLAMTGGHKSGTEATAAR